MMTVSASMANSTRFAAVEELAHLKWKDDAFRSKGTTMRELAERVWGIFQPLQPDQACFACLPSHHAIRG